MIMNENRCSNEQQSTTGRRRSAEHDDGWDGEAVHITAAVAFGYLSLTDGAGHFGGLPSSRACMES